MGLFFEFDRVDAFTVGAVGQPGQRTFLLQTRADGQRVTIKCEKQQAAAIAQYLRRVLSDLPPPSDRPMPAAMELAEPVEPVFVLGPIGLGYDRDGDRVLVQLEEMVDVDAEGEPEPEQVEDRGHLRVFLNRSQASAFCDHCDSIVAAGRPTCRWCGGPMDPEGHACPRMN
jgi:uncharacterized repeat protein (TIGR03847 family)